MVLEDRTVLRGGRVGTGHKALGSKAATEHSAYATLGVNLLPTHCLTVLTVLDLMEMPRALRTAWFLSQWPVGWTSGVILYPRPYLLPWSGPVSLQLTLSPCPD